MSHIVTIATRIHDPAAIAAVCQRQNLPHAVQGKAQLFSGEATGLLVQFPGWQYRAVIDTLTGSVRCDTFQGRWGNQAELDKFLQAYAVERAKLEARNQGFQVSEQTLPNGCIK